MLIVVGRCIGCVRQAYSTQPVFGNLLQRDAAMTKKKTPPKAPKKMSELTQNLILFGSLIVACRVTQMLVTAAYAPAKTKR